jgi:hypothetical protein
VGDHRELKPFPVPLSAERREARSGCGVGIVIDPASVDGYYGGVLHRGFLAVM